MDKVTTKNPREAAYLLLLASLKAEGFLPDMLAEWRARVQPKAADGDLAHNIACGACRMALALDHIALALTDKQSLNLKLREKGLLRTALYQQAYLTRVPSYAVVDESVELAKKYCHRTFVAFLNAILRRASEGIPPLPKGDTVPEMSVRYSYPPFFVQNLIEQNGIEEAKKVLEVGNQIPKTMVRIRSKAKVTEGLDLITGISSPVAILEDHQKLPKLVVSESVYIQNITPVLLIDNLCRKLEQPPKKILDLCAAPGGKLLLLHDHFPDAQLHANDISEERLNRLNDNCVKYGIKPKITCSPGETYESENKFDLIILDVPCTNSGVLNKRPEARWRLSEDSLAKLESMHLQLLDHARSLLAPDGEIWYLTCSVLKQENGRLIRKASEDFNLSIKSSETQLPTPEGYDGGFSASLQVKPA